MPPDLKTPVRDLALGDPVRLIATETIAEALVRLRGERLGERILYFYVTDEDGALLGVVPTRRLLLSDPAMRVSEAMGQPVFSVRLGDRLGAALELLREKRLLALPVVDERGRLAGALDVSTVTQTMFDVERKEAADEIFQIVGMRLAEENRETLGWVARNRFPWLLMNIASGLAAAILSTWFEGTLRAVVAVAFFIPLVLTIAESVAMQTVTIAIERLSVRGARARIGPDVKAGLALAAMSGAAVGGIEYAWMGEAGLASVVAIAILAAGGIGSVCGYLVPLALRRLERDPRIAAGPAVLAVTDVAALLCYFSLAAVALA